LPYPMVPSRTPYNILFSHNTCITDNGQTERRMKPRTQWLMMMINEGRINFSVALSPKTTRTRNNKPKQ